MPGGHSIAQQYTLQASLLIWYALLSNNWSECHFLIAFSMPFMSCQSVCFIIPLSHALCLCLCVALLRPVFACTLFFDNIFHLIFFSRLLNTFFPPSLLCASSIHPSQCTHRAQHHSLTRCVCVVIFMKLSYPYNLNMVNPLFCVAVAGLRATAPATTQRQKEYNTLDEKVSR